MLIYNDPINGANSSIDGNNQNQLRTYFIIRKAMEDARIHLTFTPLADTTALPKHYGKTVKRSYYVPLLDDRNINNQGLDANGATIVNGNLYGSSKDIGTINGRLPTLTENGGRVNRVGFTRIERSGSISLFGFFYEYSREAIDFDTDDELKEHLARETINGAYKITEEVLQRDLLSGATSVLFAGAASQDSEVTGEGQIPSVVTYADLFRLDQMLTESHTPRHTKIVTGVAKDDTRVIPSCRVMYIGPELVSTVKQMKDPFGEKAFIGVQHYAAATTGLYNEIGSVDNFRFIEVENMLHWAAAGAEATSANPGYRTSGKGGKEHYNVYPMLVVGDEAFSCIGFQTKKMANFVILSKAPGLATADSNDPYGMTGFSSIQWYYGILMMYPDRLGLIKTVAPL